MKKKVLIGFLAAGILCGSFMFGGYLFGSGSYKWYMKPGLSVGDMLYADKTDRVTNLTVGTSGQAVGSSGTIPLWYDKSKIGFSAVTITTNPQAMSSAEYASHMIKLNASAITTPALTAPDASGYIFLIWNSSGQTVTIKKSGGTGGSIATGKSGWAFHTGSDYVVKTLD